MSQTMNETQSLMEAALSHLNEELKNLRTGRANPSLLDSVFVEVYGTQMKLRDLSNITAPEPRQLLITPFDNNNLGAISKGIEKANLGLNPIVDGNVLRINIPAMDQEARNRMVRLAWEKCESCKVAVREARRKANDDIKEQKNRSEITEDMQKRLEKEVQDLTDTNCKKAEDRTKDKEKEILSI